MSEEVKANISDLLSKMKKNNWRSNTKLITKAYNYAVLHHGDQKRRSGEPYIIHPLQVAYTLADMGLDDATICAALLHDVVEDTEATRRRLGYRIWRRNCYHGRWGYQTWKIGLCLPKRTTSRRLPKNVLSHGKRYSSYPNKIGRQTS